MNPAVHVLPTPSAEYRRSALPAPRRLREGLERWLDAGWRGGRRTSVAERLDRAGRVQEREAAFAALSEKQLHGTLERLRKAWPAGPAGAEQLDEALAAIAAAARRVHGQNPYREQIMAALALEEGCLVEMATGEGKTLTLALAGVLAAWRRRPVHILTANDYLATRDAEALRGLYAFCGATVAAVTGEADPAERAKRYAADIVYTTSRELVADFLRDRLRYGAVRAGERRLLRAWLGAAGTPAGVVLRGLHTVLVDEADHLLIDEAVTPLIISAPRRDVALEETCREAARLAAGLRPGEDYDLDERDRAVRLRPAALRRLEEEWHPRTPILRGRRWRREWVEQALKAREFFQRDKHYAVQEGKVLIIDEGTGRTMAQRTWRQGLHQLVELKEGVALSPSSVTVASLSFQRFFRQVPRLAGVTGTARENARELWHIYRLPLVVAPTHRPSRRQMGELRVFLRGAERWAAVVTEIERLHGSGRPVLVGTRSVEASRELAEMIERRCINYQLLNAMHHRREAEIVAQAGQAGFVTVATNMAGRGTDIRLGAGVAEAGGLVVIATELHESGRVDRQLHGRCGRQGDPGEVIGFVALDDELLRRHAPRWMRWAADAVLRRSGGKPWVTAAARWVCHLAQARAQRRAYQARLEVLRHDRWIDEAFGAAE